MTRVAYLFAGVVVLILLAAFPLVASGYYLALAISLVYFTVLATAWALFSGPTHYITLCTAAFFGIGAYTAAVLAEVLPWAVILVVAALLAIAVALVVGLSTLRLSGIYFVIFTFGLSEMIRQLVAWYEVNIHGSVGRYIFIETTQQGIYWRLLALAVVVFAVGWLIGRSRLGLALRVIGADETVARHAGIDTTRAKLALFAVSSCFMALTGAIMAPRWTYIDPAISFNSLISFEVVIMALLGGAGVLWGPLVGAVPLVLLFEVLTANFPNHFSILLGLIFIVIVYFLPNGVAGLLEQRIPRLRAGIAGRMSKIGEKLVRHIWSKPAARTRQAFDATPVLTMSGLRKSFGGLVAADDVAFETRRGEILGLIGPNGSGKTTVLNLISGSLRPDKGDIRLNGVPLVGLPAHRIAQLGVARTFQLVRVLGSLSCVENVIAGLAFRSPALWGAEAVRAARALIERVDLTEKADVPAAQLTYIDQKRLELARALAIDPVILLLDEWLAGLNPKELEDGIAVIRRLRDEGVTIIMVEHMMDAIRSLCDRCVVMNAGRKIAEGPPSAVLADREVVHAYLGEGDA
ncbi:MAG: ABC transporter ATP-binding protein [Betaproteobacteria bacterium RIFCSPLOWO2_02_FULL_63_19]|nr:MAG: ABC transporter ATP-binding protein [Betaproteobacteria bacterium RIFCSPLOWO2_02_FULL_63_19]